jgi:uncharacterized membrane protein HdeD (DUF308 family)
VNSSSELQSLDLGAKWPRRYLIASGFVLLVCGILAIVLPLAFSVGVAALLGWLFVCAAVAHLVFGIHFEGAHWGWHALVAGFYGIAAINLLVNPLLGIVLLALLVGLVLIAEGIVEIFLFFVLREYRCAIWVMIDGIVTLVFGGVICAQWPPDTPDIIQYLVGIGFLSSGISRMVLAFAIPVAETTTASVD